MTATLLFGAGVLALVLLLTVPLQVAFRVEGIEAFSARITLRWLFGLVSFRICLPRGARCPARETRAAKARTAAKRGKRGGGFDLPAALRQAAFRKRLFRLVRDLLAAAHLHRLQLRMRLGLGDPADTGRLWALLVPLQLMVQQMRHADVQVEPDFIDAAFVFQAQGRLLLIPLQLLALLIGFALSPASIRAWRGAEGDHA